MPALMVFGFVSATRAATQDTPTVEVDYSNPGLAPSHWVLTIHPDGSGHFKSERGTGPAPQSLDAPNIDRDITVTSAFAERVFAQARAHSYFTKDCESHMKVAFQGWKRLTYRGPDGQGSCTYNYSKDKSIQELGDSLVAVGSAIVEGARLETLLQHDPLGLDREMDYLVDAAGDGRVQQLGVIRGILTRLAQDDAVMERVRRRARLLLARTDG
jgi:hypothetical protein